MSHKFQMRSERLPKEQNIEPLKLQPRAKFNKLPEVGFLDAQTAHQFVATMKFNQSDTLHIGYNSI
jgi:hypothetical protein